MEGYRESRIKREELNLEEINIIKEASRQLGISAFKITGGEPTLRDDLVDIVRILKENKSYVSITTNASLIHKHLPGLVDAGINHVNVSLHALNEASFQRITGSKMLRRVLDNLKMLREYGVPVKINFVILRGLNENDIPRIIDLAAELNAVVQFIELHPVGKAVKTFKEHYLPRWRVLELLEDRIVSIDYRLGLHNRPIIVLDNGVKVELVGPVGNFLFCAGCTRIRITYDFKLLPCLNWEGPPIEVRPQLRKTPHFDEKVALVVKAIKEANRLRRPFVMYPLGAKIPIPRGKWRTMRLGLPKSDGRLVYTGRSAERHLKLYISEWGRYALF